MEGSGGTEREAREAQNRKRPEEVTVSMQAPEKTQVNKHRPQTRGQGAPGISFRASDSVCECVSMCVVVVVVGCVQWLM